MIKPLFSHFTKKKRHITISTRIPLKVKNDNWSCSAQQEKLLQPGYRPSSNTTTTQLSEAQSFILWWHWKMPLLGDHSTTWSVRKTRSTTFYYNLAHVKCWVSTFGGQDYFDCLATSALYHCTLPKCCSSALFYSPPHLYLYLHFHQKPYLHWNVIILIIIWLYIL